MMPKIFSRLIERSLGWAEVAQPVLPSRFTPVAERRSEERIVAAADEAPAIEAGPSDFARQDVFPSAQTAAVPPSLDFPGEREPATIAEPAIREITVQEKREHRARVEETDIDRSADQNGSGSEVERKESPSGKPMAPSRMVLVEKRDDSPRAPAALRRTERNEPLIPREQEKEPAPFRAAAIRARTASPALLKKQTGDKIVDRPRSIPAGESVAGPPVIKVHIGRIEVRAVTPPALSPKKEAGPERPRLTLEDYLSRRERGRT
jgi:hypothetical protein